MAGSRGGPKTERGKAVVRLNPMRHGVLSQTPVIPLVESQEDWERLRDGLFEYWRPDGMMQSALVERIAMIVWRQYRVVRFESESIVAYLKDVPRDWKMARMAAGMPVPDEVTPEVVQEMDRMLSARLLPGDETIDKIMRYEVRLHRFLLQTIHQLLTLKGLRVEGGSRSAGIHDPNPVGMGRKQPRMIARNDYVPPLPPGSLGTNGSEA
ncbi:MAG: hypothetical protein ABI559_05995 [Chloroflexota bacterium]